VAIRITDPDSDRQQNLRRVLAEVCADPALLVLVKLVKHILRHIYTS